MSLLELICIHTEITSLTIITAEVATSLAREKFLEELEKTAIVCGKFKEDTFTLYI